MKTVQFVGPALTQSGYGVHSRQVIRWLMSREDVDLRVLATPWGDTPWLLNSDNENGLIGEIMRRTVNKQDAADISIQLQLPNEWNPNLAKTNIGITAAIETDKCNSNWPAFCKRMSTVVFPSEHAKASITNVQEIENALVIPEAYHSSVTSPTNVNAFEFDTKFNFLIFGQITGNNPLNDRKNTFLTIKWLCETFKDNKDVGIVIKTNAGRNSKIDRTIVTNMMNSLLNEVRKGPYPKIHLLHGDLSNDDVSNLYSNPGIKALISLTRGEGYGLPTLEAAVAGLPVVATNWSGHLDYLKKGKFISIFYQLNEVHHTRIDDNLFVKGARWANPSEEDFKRKIKKFYDSPTTPTQWAKDLSEILKVEYSQEAINKLYDENLGKYFL